MNRIQLINLGVGIVSTSIVAACSSPAPIDGPGDDERESVRESASGSQIRGPRWRQQPAASRLDDGAPACGGLEKSACVTCCQMAFPRMDLAVKQTFAQCACGSPGECSDSCGASYCAGNAPTEECAACLAGSEVCMPATTAVCQGVAECKAYLACSGGCK
jgi:hypothetical protein